MASPRFHAPELRKMWDCAGDSFHEGKTARGHPSRLSASELLSAVREAASEKRNGKVLLDLRA